MSNKRKSEMLYCPLLKREISEGYCWELCNIGTDDILLNDDKIPDWDEAQEVCKECGIYEN